MGYKSEDFLYLQPEKPEDVAMSVINFYKNIVDFLILNGFTSIKPLQEPSVGVRVTYKF